MAFVRLLRLIWGSITRLPRPNAVLLIFLALLVVGGLGAHFLQHRLAGEKRIDWIDWITVLAFAMLLPVAASSAFIAYVSSRWLTKQREMEKRDTIYAEPLATPIQMAQRRLDVVTSCKKLKTDVYCTSHCNLFYDPGASQSASVDEKDEIVYLNRKFFKALAHLTIDSRPGLKLLLHAASPQEFAGELGERIDLYLEVGGSKESVLDTNHFDPKSLVQESLSDYFVFEDHVFLTLRKSSKGKTEYVHILRYVLDFH
jgi:hypothetical protein